MPTRLCLEPACGIPATYRGRCREHATKRDRDINRAGYKIYRTKKWQMTRNSYLAAHPLCECDDPTCERIATDVHHRTDIAQGGNPWSFDNLQALTHECHSRITRSR